MAIVRYEFRIERKDPAEIVGEKGKVLFEIQKSSY
jgi:hypothetical protein